MMLLSVEFDNLVAKGIAGLGALFYVAVRVWQSLARAEAIDVYPLLRPFAVGF
ncbi:conjugative transposon protein TraJ, partial [Phocaeicola dorei]|nr:conjugative transposon protein TraJ [Phocaeicola dorei]